MIRFVLRSAVRLASTVLLLSGAGAACEQRAPAGDAETPDPPSVVRPPDEQDPRAVDPSRLQPGDRWFGLRVEATEVRPETVDSFGWTGRVRLSGPLSLSGDYQPHPSYPELAELCFYPDSSSAATLPRFPNDMRTSWFCFRNQEFAQAALDPLPTRGRATIVIDDFEYLYQHTDTYNTARLDRVLSGS